ncbi:alpha/beta fold hydrolase [Bacillus sp. JCM 19034]|uniref:alpha/beta fold hydrolase n=1 Tax=Bacillus sp. JCM 19034 TaxID=1481928 RepID=UPI000780EE8E|nr:alpha/beta hydrolase [Bacillus sp. JCM 19034]
MNGLITIRGKKLYVETAGNENAPVLLFLHGGPGEGCYSHSFYQKERLSKSVRWVSFDQRGVLRSEPLVNDETFRLQDIIEDIEVLRQKLGIEKWVVWGHSFGGYLAILYTQAYPLSVEALIFESPSFDLDLSFRSLLHGAAKVFVTLGDDNNAIKSLRYANGSYSTNIKVDMFLELSQKLGSNKDHLYFREYESIYPQLVIPKEIQDLQEQSFIHLDKLKQEGLIYESLLTKLPHINVPTLLLTGAYDLVTCEKQINTYLEKVPKGELYQFENSGHNPSWEEADAFSEKIVNYMKRLNQ